MKTTLLLFLSSTEVWISPLHPRYYIFNVIHFIAYFQVHIIETHVAEFLKLKDEIAGLGFWSEQSMESGHHDFKLEWEKVKVSTNHVEYTERLFTTVIRYAGKHL